MEKERYELKDIDKAMVFEFTSIGPKGEIPKLVMYSKTEVENFYNLSFGDKNIYTNDIDDTDIFAISDNKDSKKVLATVASTIYTFTNRYPDAWIGATGSSDARTRLYQMSISNNLEEILRDFAVIGVKDQRLYLFEKNTRYDAFLITLKKNMKWKIP